MMHIRRGLIILTIILFQINILQAQDLWRPWYITPRSGAQHIDLDGKWELSYMDSAVSDLAQLSDRKEPFETTIPNSVQWSLCEAGKLPHPYYYNNSSLYSWTDKKVWYYTRTFEVPASAKGNYIFLCFDGLDYFSKVWVNDTLLGVHEGMFGGPNIEISRLVKFDAANKIVVELRAGDWGKWSSFKPRASGSVMKPWVISGGTGGEAFFSLGMWQGVRLEIVPKIHLERPFLVIKNIAGNEAKLHLSGEIFYNANSFMYQLHPWKNEELRHPDEKGMPFIPVQDPAKVLVEFFLAGKMVYSKASTFKLFEGRNWYAEDIDLPHPQLWNPTGLGTPNLYKIRISLIKDGGVLDKIEFPYGVRTIERIASSGPRTGDFFENWQFVINGRKIFVKGVNFTPQDVLLETSEDRYRWTLSAAKAMGVQMIRVWGGGLLETNTFYKLCDEMGIMVWQDFPIGNEETAGYPQDIWESEVVQNICRLRNHPSLAVWCGGNEMNPYSYGNATTIGILERNLKIFDNTRSFQPADPDGGDIHVYPDMDPAWYNRSYRYEPFISETGMHSMPEASVFYEIIDHKELTGLGRMWDTAFAKTHPEFIHHFTEYGPNRVPRMLSRASHINDMNDPSIESLTEATQIGAAEFYQIVSEKVQGNYPVTTGLMPWVFKRHWPVIAIQLMDWFGQASAPYYFLKRTYEPVHVYVDLPRLLWAPGEKMELNVRVLNSPEKPANDYKASITVYDDRFRKVYRNEKPVHIRAGTSVNSVALGNYTIPGNYRDRFLFMLAELHDGAGRLISRSYYYPRCLALMENKTFHDKYVSEPVPWVTLNKGPWLKPTVGKTSTSLSIKLLEDKALSEKESEIKVRIRNDGKIPAFMTKIDITGVKRAFYASDNYIWLPPGESKEITITVLWRGKKEGSFVEAEAWNAAAAKSKLE